MADPYENLEPAEDDPDVPDWDDEYIDRVSDRLMFNYDLDKDYTVRDERFALYGEMRMVNEKHFFHPALSYAHHESFEHLFARRRSSITVSDLERLVDLGHDLADDWIDHDEEHFSTEFIFVDIVDEIPDAVREFVTDFRDRTLIKHGFHGHYEIHLVAVAPEAEALAASRKAHVEEAFRLWDPIEEEEPGLWDLFTRRMQL